MEVQVLYDSVKPWFSFSRSKTMRRHGRSLTGRHNNSSRITSVRICRLSVHHLCVLHVRFSGHHAALLIVHNVWKKLCETYSSKPCIFPWSQIWTRMLQKQASLSYLPSPWNLNANFSIFSGWSHCKNDFVEYKENAFYSPFSGGLWVQMLISVRFAERHRHEGETDDDELWLPRTDCGLMWWRNTSCQRFSFEATVKKKSLFLNCRTRLARLRGHLSNPQEVCEIIFVILQMIQILLQLLSTPFVSSWFQQDD